MNPRHRRSILIGTALFAVAGPLRVAEVARGQAIDGFLAPYRTVSVATAETGIVREVVVREGEHVEQGQAIAELDNDVYSSLLAIAQQSMQSEGRVAAALAEAKLREARLDKLRELLSRGNAGHEEVERAETDLEIARANLLALREDLLVKKLDCERAKVQLARRRVVAPMRGVVVELLKEEGEFVGPNDPHLATLVQLDPLLATFAAPANAARRLAIGERVRIRIAGEEALQEGAVEYVAPVVDGKSGTVRVKVLLENAEGRWRSGEPCSLVIDQPWRPTVPTEEDESLVPAFPKLRVRSLQQAP